MPINLTGSGIQCRDSHIRVESDLSPESGLWILSAVLFIYLFYILLFSLYLFSFSHFLFTELLKGFH